MAFIVIDKDNKEQMRSNMREQMRRGYRSMKDGMGGDYREGYRHGYKHGWEDHEDESGEMREDENYRRGRSGRFM